MAVFMLQSADLSRCDRHYMADKAVNIYYSILYRKSCTGYSIFESLESMISQIHVQSKSSSTLKAELLNIVKEDLSPKHLKYKPTRKKPLLNH